MTDAARPSAVRVRIVGLLLAYSALCHINRMSISVAGTEQIIPLYKIEPTTMGWVYSAYLIVYTILMTPGGLFIDRFGAKRALLIQGFGSALFVLGTALCGWTVPAAFLVAALMVVRGLLGAVNAPLHPACAHAASRWVPASALGRANGLITCAALLGIASTYYVVGSLMDWIGWPGTFAAGAAVTTLVAVAWARFAADDPRDHPGVNEEERRQIRGSEGGAKSAGAAPEAGGIGGFSLACLTASYAALGYFQYLFFYWMEYYFDTVLKLGKGPSRGYSTICVVAMAAGMVAGGWLTDRAVARFGARRGRAAVAIGGMAGSAALLLVGILAVKTAWIVAAFSISMAYMGATEAAFWTTAVELGGRRGGTAAAIMNTGGNFGGLLAPIVTPYFSKYFGWQNGLAVACVFAALGAVLWGWVRPPTSSSPPAQVRSETR